MFAKPLRRRLGALAAVLALSCPAAFADTVRVALIELLSGPLAPTGDNLLRSYRLFSDIAARENWSGAGHTLEFVPFDNKGSAQEALALLKAAADQGFRYVAQGTSSEIAAALIEAIEQHNARNPGRELLFLNHAAVDPVLTNEKCSFWHFRFDAHSDMKMEGLSGVIAADRSIRKVYVIGQDYSFGRQVSRAAREYLGRKRPDIEIVGDELHPIARVRDFAPYVARIMASGADTVLTGNWGSDLALLIKAARDAGLKATFHTYYGGMSSGVMGTMGAAEVGKVRQIGNWHPNIENFPGQAAQEEFRRRNKDTFYATPTFTIVAMLSKAFAKAGSTDPLRVAFALENMSIEGFAGGPVTMRAEDHQVQGTLFVSSWAKADGRAVRYDEEGTGYGWRPERSLPPHTLEQPTSCRMRRPPPPAAR